MGVSGCGKSTIGKALADGLGIPFYDGDDYHPESNIKKMASGKPLNDEDRQPWLETIHIKASESLQTHGCVIACSALKEAYRSTLSNSISTNVTWVYLKGEFDTILQRMQDRDHFMPPHLLESQFDTLEEPSDAIIIDISEAPECIIKRISILSN